MKLLSLIAEKGSLEDELDTWYEQLNDIEILKRVGEETHIPEEIALKLERWVSLGIEIEELLENNRVW